MGVFVDNSYQNCNILTNSRKKNIASFYFMMLHTESVLLQVRTYWSCCIFLDHYSGFLVEEIYGIPESLNDLPDFHGTARLVAD